MPRIYFAAVSAFVVFAPCAMAQEPSRPVATEAVVDQKDAGQKLIRVILPAPWQPAKPEDAVRPIN